MQTKKVDEMTQKIYVGCNSHNLNLEVNHIVEGYVQLKCTILIVHKTIRSAKKLKRCASL